MTAKHDEDRLLDHNYDGIQEYDNPMPRWWLWIFWITIAWAALFWFNVAGIGVGKGRIADYDASVAAANEARPPEPAAGPSAEQLVLMSQDTATVGAGKAIFAKNCAVCHGPDGGGVIGPNLTDAAWIHGGTPEAIYTSVHDGVLAKGMPAWGLIMKPEEVSAVVAYVITLRGTTPASPKAAEGVETPATP